MTTPTGSKDEIIVVDKEGDVIFVVGPQKRKVQVLSSVFALASPVFKAMFDPVFSEGQHLAENRAKKQATEIQLPEDNVQALTIISKTLHYQLSPEQNFTIRSETVLDIAIVADKYNMISSLAYASEVWMRKIRSKPVFADARWPPHAFWRLALCAIIFRKPQQFEELTKSIILGGENLGAVFSRASRVDKHLEYRLLYKLQDAKLSATILDSRHMLFAAAHKSLLLSTNCTCGGSSEIVSNFLLESSKNEVEWPTATTSLLSFVEKSGKGDGFNKGLRLVKPPCKSCKKELDSATGVASAEIEVVMKTIEGFCLGCIKDEVYGKGSGDQLHSGVCKAPKTPEVVSQPGIQ